MRTSHSTLCAAALVGLAGGAARAAERAVPVYDAVYAVEYKGKDVGSSEFKVTHDAAQNLYEFTSTTLAKGLLAKLAAPRPTVERSHFKVIDGRIQPVEYWYEDGSRKGDDDRHIQFDWERKVAIVSDDDGQREVPLEDVALDPGSLHVALMQDLIAGGKPGQYRIADGEQAKAYGFEDNGDAQTETGLGTLATRNYIQHREGSSRTTYLWVAPELSYLPARIEQRKNGEVTMALTLKSVTGIEKK
jgi:hypothetical protein